jgi:hypothetical protein
VARLEQIEVKIQELLCDRVDAARDRPYFRYAEFLELGCELALRRRLNAKDPAFIRERPCRMGNYVSLLLSLEQSFTNQFELRIVLSGEMMPEESAKKVNGLLEGELGGHYSAGRLILKSRTNQQRPNRDVQLVL